MGVGRKPTPSVIKELRGNPGKRPPLIENEARPESGADRPDWLTPAAKAHWTIVAKQLDNAGVLTKMDQTALAMYCESFARWQEAQKHCAEPGGMLVKTSNGFWVQSPWVQISNKAFEQVIKMLVEFGMTPSSRTRVGAAKPPKEENPFDEFAIN